ncbi:hypothetical protein PanWU01x14_013340 [Parasponia andersonii]|uniref:Uncharacterized protein n=1 Tax=Parasponia andersonii TaxID=3476 RepID=A0A2P5E119_PARAD|nr:hypothetical protein PanWU01x14_013340 [Parasponia andersonii]
MVSCRRKFGAGLELKLSSTDCCRTGMEFRIDHIQITLLQRLPTVRKVNKAASEVIALDDGDHRRQNQAIDLGSPLNRNFLKQYGQSSTPRVCSESIAILWRRPRAFILIDIKIQ